MFDLDPFRLDRALAEAAARHARFERALRTQGDAPEHAFETLPAGLDRELLRELTEKAPADAFAAGAARWLARLLLEHGAIPEARDVARAERLERRPIDAPVRAEIGFRELLGHVLADAPRRGAWVRALSVPAAEVAARRFRLWERQAELQAEIATVPVALEPLRETRLLELAGRFSGDTEDAFAALRVRGLDELVGAGLGADVVGTFPTRLGARNLAELLREGGWFDGLDFRFEPGREPLGASSLLRALDRLGSAWHDAGASRGRPFVIAREAGGARAAAFGALLALLPLAPSFAERRLEVSRARAADHARAVSRVVLIGARTELLRASLASAAHAGRRAYLERFESETQRALGFAPPNALAGALFADERGPVRAAALFAAAAKARDLTERHDEDWFRNPRAVAELRAEIESTPPRTLPEAELESGARSLGAMLVRAL